MSENEKAHDEVRIKPSIESLRLAIEAGKGQTWAAERIIASAALFDAYLFGSLSIFISLDDCTSDFNRANGLINGLGGRLEIIKNILPINSAAKSLPVSFKQSLEQPANETFSGHSTHGSTPTVDGQHPADSYSAGRMGSLARPLSGLSIDELQQITSRTIKPWFKERAEAELALRQGEVGAS
ncbi:hypothetical protein [Bombella mellum]|uniref:AbiTii domain-containing protein n=1 Tax=Bombella mellum TaxID=2039288 RepID=A0ABR5ZRJ4_9PROT|nr:hypothetical protein [Bombella mellum]MBA5726933.1 hypothetical protein [Bombella mellum]